MRRIGIVLLALMLVLMLAGCEREARDREITAAAAANLTDVFGEMGKQFEAASGIHPVLSFASTAQLAQQIENGAPFDLFAAADAEHVDGLEKKGLIEPGSAAVYARGILALWIPGGGDAVKGIADLTSPQVRVIAIAKPELAPFGAATVESLKRAGIWDAIQPKIVYAQDINAARQYGQSKNADAVFTAYSLVLREAGKVIRVEESMHAPIEQKLGVVRGAKRAAEARKFAAFVLGDAGRKILEASGYQLAPRTP